MERLMRLFSTGSFALCILCHIGTTDASSRIELLHQSQKILFLGDSITFGGHYVAFFDAWLLTEGRGHSPMVINVGLPSETVSGLSEDGHAGGRFPRPDLAERLDRVLALTKPDLVFACYGINCGIYQPLDDERLHRYQEGIQHLKRKVDEAGATLVLITPPFYDDQRAKAPFSYNAVLDRYADWLLAQRKDGWLIVDLHGSMAAEVAKRRETAPDFTFQPDAVHPNNEGHWFMARQLIRWFGDDEAASADSPEKMLADQGASAEVMELVQKRMTVLRDAYVSAAGHKRPGIRPGLPIPEALKEAEELSEQIYQKRSPRHSTGKYMDHIWHIDEHGLVHWDGSPYVRFGFTGNGNAQQLMKAGFDQFTMNHVKGLVRTMITIRCPRAVDNRPWAEEEIFRTNISGSSGPGHPTKTSHNLQVFLFTSRIAGQIDRSCVHPRSHRVRPHTTGPAHVWREFCELM